MEKEEKISVEHDDKPVAYEVAEMVFEHEILSSLRKRESIAAMGARINDIYHIISAKLTEEGNTLPIIYEDAGIEDANIDRVTKPLSKWRQYWIDAAAIRAGMTK